MCMLVLKVVFFNKNITYVYVHVSVHVVVGMLWHCEGAPPHLKRAIWEQKKSRIKSAIITLKYVNTTAINITCTINNSQFRRVPG